MYELANAGVESEYNATTVMLGSQNSLQGARVQVEISKDMIPQVLPYLYIEDIPFSEVMDMVDEYDIKDEAELMRGLDYRNFVSMPGWKQDMVKAWTKDPSPQMEMKFKAATERHAALYEPYRQQEVIELERYERLKDSMRKQLARNFDRQERHLYPMLVSFLGAGAAMLSAVSWATYSRWAGTYLKLMNLTFLTLKTMARLLKRWPPNITSMKYCNPWNINNPEGCTDKLEAGFFRLFFFYDSCNFRALYH